MKVIMMIFILPAGKNPNVRLRLLKNLYRWLKSIARMQENVLKNRHKETLSARSLCIIIDVTENKWKGVYISWDL